ETVVVRAVSTDDMTEAGRRASNLINDSLGLKTDDNAALHYQSEDLLSQAADLQQLASSTNMMLVAIASISLLVGGIGVMNIMLVSVTERTREIGLKKAIGARRSRILGQFLTEASVLTTIGGLLGVGGGIVMAKLISSFMGIPTAVSMPAIIAATAFSMIIGLVFGLLPAVKASKLNPIEALRRE
ncbi:MAG: FtsX-like permease family protein, partial [Lachnospiraceae bacterium]|nr:FtsX-like permease family protein [Lachnospiraceae bacterium]